MQSETETSTSSLATQLFGEEAMKGVTQLWQMYHPTNRYPSMRGAN